MLLFFVLGRGGEWRSMSHCGGGNCACDEDLGGDTSAILGFVFGEVAEWRWLRLGGYGVLEYYTDGFT